MRLRHFLHTVRSRLFGPGAPVIPVIRLHGTITPGKRFGQGLSLASVEPLIDRAFSMPGLTAVALQINSPGGSVVQSAQIADRIRMAAQEKNVPVLAFAEDVAASGGYMLALAGDEIYVHEASLVGSIGVIAGGFGMSDLIKQYGIERRSYTAGEKKSTLDPFQPENEEDVQEFQLLLDEVHDIFKDYVRDRRGKRLKSGAARARAFSGRVFLGGDAQKLGLVDGIGEVRTTIKTRFGANVRMPKVEERKPLFGRLSSKGEIVGRDSGFAGDFAGQLISAAEERMIWARFGL